VKTNAADNDVRDREAIVSPGCVVERHMGLNARAAPGVEQRAELAVVSACHLADVVTPTAWSTGAAEDALDAIDVLAAAVRDQPPRPPRPSPP
jgi:uncharacterized membrane protein